VEGATLDPDGDALAIAERADRKVQTVEVDGGG
jgi:hypothetical protein